MLIAILEQYCTIFNITYRLVIITLVHRYIVLKGSEFYTRAGSTNYLQEMTSDFTADFPSIPLNKKFLNFGVAYNTALTFFAMEQQEVIDLSHLTEEERVKLMAVVGADEELRVLNLR